MTIAVGIIIGGTNTSIALVGDHGIILEQKQLKTEAELGYEWAIRRLTDAILTLSDKAGISKQIIKGIGIGCTGPVDFQTGTILTDFTLPGWGNRNLVKSFEDEFGVPVILENNVDAATFGEYFLSSEKHLSKIVLLTFGTGVGGGVLTEGQIYRGVSGWHPEIGHIPVRKNGPACYCGIRGCLEMAASGTAIARVARSKGLKSSEEVFYKFAKGDPVAARIIKEVEKSVCSGLWAILHTFMPDKIIFGGGIMESHFELFEPAIRKTLNQSTMIPGDQVTVCKAKPGNHAGMVGAAILSLTECRAL